MEVKNVSKKQRGKSVGIKTHNSALSKIPRKNNNIKKIKSISQINKKIPSNEKNERALSDQNNQKLFQNNINNIFPKQKKFQRPKSYNLMRRGHKNENSTNKKRPKIINNIQIHSKEIKINLAVPKNQSVNKNINNINISNKKQKPVSSYNAFKGQKNSINKISSTEEKKGIKKSHQPKIEINNLFSQIKKKEVKNINSSINNKINKNSGPIKSATNKNEKSKNNKLIPHKPKMFSKSNKSIENQKQNNAHNIPDKNKKIFQKEKFQDFLNKKMLNSAQKKEKEKSNKYFNAIKNLNKKFINKNNNIKENNINKIINNNKKKENNKLKEKKPEKKSEKTNQKITQIKDYTQPTLIGLNNIGSTCFINAILQCLSQTKELTNYFLNEKNKDKFINNNIALKNISDNQLTPSYLELINKLWNKTSETKSISPSNFVQKLNDMNPLFKLGEAGDSKDFIIFILEQIHNELKKPLNIKTKTLDPLNQYDKTNSFDHFFNDFKLEVSIISDLFFGIHETTNVCLNCKANYESKNLIYPICYNYGIFNCLIFPLEEVKNMQLKNNMNQGNNQASMNSNNIVNIYDCFDFYQKSDLFTGDNKYFCNICRQLNDSIYTCKIYTSPNYLIIILNRGKGNIYNVKLDFPLSIDITNYVLQKETPNIIYNLYGVVTHIGQSGPNAHFVASCKSPVDGKWYRYNDALVNMITDVKKEIMEFGTPYILFYQKEK